MFRRGLFANWPSFRASQAVEFESRVRKQTEDSLVWAFLISVFLCVLMEPSEGFLASPHRSKREVPWAAFEFASRQRFPSVFPFQQARRRIPSVSSFEPAPWPRARGIVIGVSPALQFCSNDLDEPVAYRSEWQNMHGAPYKLSRMHGCLNAVRLV